MTTITSDTTTMTTIISDTTINSTTIIIIIIFSIIVVFLLVVVMTCSVVFIVNIKKIKSMGGMLEETTDGGIEIKNNEAYGIVNRGGRCGDFGLTFVMKVAQLI